MQAKNVIPYALVREITGQVAGYFKPHERSIAPSKHGIRPEKKKKNKEFRISFKKNKKVALLSAVHDLPGLCFRTGLEFKLAHK